MRHTVCVLLYGSYPRLAERLIKSLDRPEFSFKFALRVGMNACCEETKRSVAAIRHRPLHVIDSAENILKYPMMRRLLYERIIITPNVMWFDDDSFLRDADVSWWDKVDETLQSAEMCGLIYSLPLRGQQKEWISRQPWYTGKPIENPVRFCTGGWWAIRTDILEKHDWPLGIEHNGGDVMLGALCHQQGYRMRHWTHGGVCVNADDSGKASSMPRRGVSQLPVGVRL